VILAERVRAVPRDLGVAFVRVRLGLLAQAGALAAILAVVFLAYSRILSQWFVADDFWYLRAAQTASFGFVLNSFDYTAPGPVPEGMYRPLYPIAFLFTYKLFGLTAWQYHLLSIAVHMVNTVLVFLVARKLTGRASVAYIAAFIFGLHPAYAPAVAWITNNVSVFAMAFSLGSVLLFLNFLDGGPRRWLCYGGSFVGIIFAMLIHPESMAALAAMVLAYLVRHVQSLEDLRSLRRYLPVLPYVIAAIALFGVLQYTRANDPYQKTVFTLGSHMATKFPIYVAHLGNPFGVNDLSWQHWRSLIPMLGVSLSAFWLLVAPKSFDLRVRLLVIVWFLLAVLPLTTYNVAIHSRKLYVAGVPFALMMAMVAVALSDWLAPRLRPLDLRSPDWRYTPIAAGLVLAAFALPLRTWQVTDEPHMADASLLHLDSQTYKAMTDQVRLTYPALPEGARLDLVWVPWPLLAFGVLDSPIAGVIDSPIADAIQIYYGEIEIFGVGDPSQLPPPNSLGRFLVGFTCPPVCGPPLPPELVAAIWQAQHPGQTLPSELER